jgi:hypothetical protein
MSVDLAQFTRRLAEILEADTAVETDWLPVNDLSLSLLGDLTGEDTYDVPREVWHFLEDWKLRRTDRAYADRQREAVTRFLASQA